VAEKIVHFPGLKNITEDFLKKQKEEEEKLKKYRWAGPLYLTIDECGIPLIAFFRPQEADFSKIVAVLELRAPSEEEQDILWKAFFDLMNRYFRMTERIKNR
jgi:hypothetical protein